MTLFAWLHEIAQTPPQPLTRRQWAIVAMATLIGGISRLVTIARAPWDWDEFLFLLAADHFDVGRHHPHPPGFPLFIVGAKLIRKFGFDNFHALQAMSIVAAIAIVPSMFFLCRELRMRFTTSISASLLLAFFPNVWFFGGTAFSDVPSMTLIVIVIALFLAGCRDARAYFAGAMLLGIAAGLRPQNLLIGFVPLLIASSIQIRRSTNRVIAAALIIAIIVGASYGAAAGLTGWTSYSEAMHNHSRFIIAKDSFLAPHRPSLWKVFLEFFVKPYRAPVVNALVTLFAVISVGVSIAKRRWHVLFAIASFAPFCVFAWLMLDRLSTGRFSIGYAPLVALLVADGIRLALRSDLAESIAGTVVIAVMIAWAWPAFIHVRDTTSPPAAAAEWIRKHADPKTSVIYVDEAMDAAAQWYLPEYRRVSTPDSAYQLREGRAAGAITFTHPRDRLWKIVRRRYFEVSVVPPRPIS
jgi:hypothetical protein